MVLEKARDSTEVIPNEKSFRMVESQCEPMLLHRSAPSVERFFSSTSLDQ
jgi:hypothetical protein